MVLVSLSDSPYTQLSIDTHIDILSYTFIFLVFLPSSPRLPAGKRVDFKHAYFRAIHFFRRFPYVVRTSGCSQPIFANKDPFRVRIVLLNRGRIHLAVFINI